MGGMRIQKNEWKKVSKLLAIFADFWFFWLQNQVYLGAIDDLTTKRRLVIANFIVI